MPKSEGEKKHKSTFRGYTHAIYTQAQMTTKFWYR